MTFHDGIAGGPIELLTDTSGEAEFPVKLSDVRRVIVAPLTGYWTVEVDSPSSALVVDCPPLDLPEDGLGWWHHALGIRQPNPNLGQGIRIGLLETGVGSHSALARVTRVGTWAGGKYHPDHPRDGITLHGTHVCGILNARPVKRGGFWGIAPGAEVIAGSCYGDRSFAAQYDLANGVLALARQQEVDLINLSQRSLSRSLVLLEAIQEAADHGCLCIRAAGNTQGAVHWPARSPATVAVSAVGQLGSCPDRTRSASLLDASLPAGDEMFFASFSSFGQEVDCCAPGVGVISTVPEVPGLQGQFWAPMDGTSMAAPAACGALAVRLSRSRLYRESERNRDRTRLARRMLTKSCWPNNLDPDHQGKGMPSIRSRLRNK